MTGISINLSHQVVVFDARDIDCRTGVLSVRTSFLGGNGESLSDATWRVCAGFASVEFAYSKLMAELRAQRLQGVVG
jgi:hypothetical protein